MAFKGNGRSSAGLIKCSLVFAFAVSVMNHRRVEEAGEKEQESASGESDLRLILSLLGELGVKEACFLWQEPEAFADSILLLFRITK